MDIRDRQRIKQIRDNTEKMADAFARIANALERLTDPNNCETCNHWWKSEEVCLLDDCHYEPQTMPIKKTMTGSKGERIEYTETEMVIRESERSRR